MSFFSLKESNFNNSLNRDYQTPFSLNAGLGLEVKVLDKLYLNTEGNFNYQLQPFKGDNEIKPYIYSIQFGIEYKF